MAIKEFDLCVEPEPSWAELQTPLSWAWFYRM